MIPVRPDRLDALLRAATPVGSRLEGVFVADFPQNLTRAALREALEGEPENCPDALVPRYVLTQKSVTLVFDGAPIALRFLWDGGAELSKTPPQEDAFDVSALFKPVLGTPVLSVCAAPDPDSEGLLRARWDFENHKTLTAYALPGHTLAGVLCGDRADTVSVRELLKIGGN